MFLFDMSYRHHHRENGFANYVLTKKNRNMRKRNTATNIELE